MTAGWSGLYASDIACFKNCRHYTDPKPLVDAIGLRSLLKLPTNIAKEKSYEIYKGYSPAFSTGITNITGRILAE
jgi:hypothetical protein